MIRSEAFPVPTIDNPNAVFHKDEFIERPSSEPASNGGDERHQLLRELAMARADNRRKTAEDYRRTRDFEQCKRAWKLENDKNYKESKAEELALLGLPESCAYLVETSQYAWNRHRSTNASVRQHHKQEEDVDIDAKVYERSLKRIIVTTGKDDDSNTATTSRLVKDLQAREERNLKRTKPDDDSTMGGINKQNAIFNKSLSRTMAKDVRAQTIKQNLERGTAL